MTSGYQLIWQAQVHEVGHSFMRFLLAGEFAPVEIKWSEPGSGTCLIRWPARWADDEQKFRPFTVLTRAAGLEAEALVCGPTDAKHSAGDLGRLAAAVPQMAEFRRSSPREAVAVIRTAAASLLRPHERARPAVQHGAAQAALEWGGLGGGAIWQRPRLCRA